MTDDKTTTEGSNTPEAHAVSPGQAPAQPGVGSAPNRATQAAMDGVARSMVGAHEVLERLRAHRFTHDHPPVRNANQIQEQSLSFLERAAIAITDKVGSMGFFNIILIWTILWTGYNIVSTELPSLGLRPFDPFPAFVAYLLISNVIQILLMPLIMVGQNLQGRHSETRAELDFEINKKAEQEVVTILEQIQHNTELVLHLMRHLDCQIPASEVEKLVSGGVPATEAEGDPKS